jgi:hypothetical protein
MLPQLIKSGWVKSLTALGVLCAFVFHLIAVMILYNKGDSFFPLGQFVLPIVYVGAMWVFSRCRQLFSGLPTSTKQDGFFQRIQYDDWKAILDEAISTDHTPLTNDENMHIMFGPLRTDLDQVGSWRDRGLLESSEKLAETRLMNPFLTLDRVRFASWLVRELKQNPDLLDAVTIRNSPQLSHLSDDEEGEQDVDPKA